MPAFLLPDVMRHVSLLATRRSNKHSDGCPERAALCLELILIRLAFHDVAHDK